MALRDAAVRAAPLLALPKRTARGTRPANVDRASRVPVAAVGALVAAVQGRRGAKLDRLVRVGLRQREPTRFIIAAPPHHSTEIIYLRLSTN